MAHNCANCVSAGQARRLPWRLSSDNKQRPEFDSGRGRGAGFRLMDDRTNKGDSELGILARRRIEAAIITPIYDEMREAIGEEKARDILGRAIRRAAIDAGAEMAARANEAKLIVDGRVPEAWVASFPPATPVFLQPEGNKPANVTLAVDAAKRHPARYRLSLQTHKFIGVR